MFLDYSKYLTLDLNSEKTVNISTVFLKIHMLYDYLHEKDIEISRDLENEFYSTIIKNK